MKKLENIADSEALEVAKILGGADHLSEESRIFQVKELLAGRFNKVTNIPGVRWYRAFKYLEVQGYEIEEL